MKNTHRTRKPGSGAQRAPHSARSGAGRGDAGASRGAAIPPRPQGQGLRAPAASRRSAGSHPGPAAARPRRRRAESGPQQPGPRVLPGARRGRRGERGARNLLSACGGSPAPAPGNGGGDGGGGRPHPRPRPPRPAALRARPYLSQQAGVRPQRPRRRQLPPGRRIPAPSANHNTEQAAVRGEGVGTDLRLRGARVTVT